MSKKTQKPKYQEPQDFFTSISFSELMGELIEKQNIMQNFDIHKDIKDIFEKKLEPSTPNSLPNPYLPINHYTKSIKLGSEIDKIWNSKHNPDFINKIFM